MAQGGGFADQESSTLDSAVKSQNLSLRGAWRRGNLKPAVWQVFRASSIFNR
jgi:hypothetical protein